MVEVLPLTSEFFAIITNTKYTERRLMVFNDMPQYDTHFITSTSDSLLELVLFKSTFIKIFQECHPVLESFLDSGQLIEDEAMLAKVYILTIGMLLTTNENHTAINIHDDIVWRLLYCEQIANANTVLSKDTFLRNELFFLRTLLNSDVNKLNKSSSYWHLLKKLFIFVHGTNSWSGIERNFFIDTVLVSAKMHRSNYYAWNFLRFMTNVYKAQGDKSNFDRCMLEVINFCKMNRDDSSAWACFTDIVEVNMNELKMTTWEYNRNHSIPLTLSCEKIFLVAPSIKERLMSLSKWLWDSKCLAEVPYYAFRRLLLYAVKQNNELVFVRQLMEQVVVHCSMMEQVWMRERGVDVIVKRGYFITNVELDKDLILRDHVQTYFNWKRLLNWHTEFIFDKYLQNLKVE